jgi:hypothetical protein
MRSIGTAGPCDSMGRGGPGGQSPGRPCAAQLHSARHRDLPDSLPSPAARPAACCPLALAFRFSGFLPSFFPFFFPALGCFLRVCALFALRRGGGVALSGVGWAGLWLCLMGLWGVLAPRRACAAVWAAGPLAAPVPLSLVCRPVCLRARPGPPLPLSFLSLGLSPVGSL